MRRHAGIVPHARWRGGLKCLLHALSGKCPHPKKRVPDETHCPFPAHQYCRRGRAGHCCQPAGRQPLPQRQRAAPGRAAGLCRRHRFWRCADFAAYLQADGQVEFGRSRHHRAAQRRRGLAAANRAELCAKSRYRHARSGYLPGRAQRVCHRGVSRFGAGGGLHRAVGGHDARGGRSRHRPRSGAYCQRRYGDDDADSGRDEYVCGVFVACYRLRGGQFPAQE